MSGPSGRTRNKKQKASGLEAISEILRRIQFTRTVTKEELLRFFRLDREECHCRSNSKENPLCFCGLTPPANSTRKQGLWQKVSDITDELGADPSNELRRSLETPAGLTNLGATCYVNSVLQCLYMNTAFRDGIFAAERELVINDPVLHQLARLFAQLQSGKRSSVDSAAFASILELDSATQQDGQEFLKLLLSLLERVLAQSRVPEAQHVIQNLFRGTFSYVTKCSTCGKESPASDQLVDFYEIEANVKGFRSLEESLDDYLSEEKLQGENQYSCENCKERVDATHSTKLRSLPPVLSFQLKRFVFNAKTATKKKVTSKFSFPEVLDMEKRVSSGDPALYDLYAILAHKGNTATSGHYVAHIKDERTGQWWQFDDEEVTSLGSHPLEEETKNSKESSPDRDDNMLTSADAYMLMYSRRTQDSAREERSRCIPEFLRSEVEESNDIFVSGCDFFREMKEDEVERITKRKAEVREVLGNVSVRPIASKSFWILTEWLRNWADSLGVISPIDNSELLCEHGRVSPKKTHLMKCISEAAWHSLHTKYGGGPELTVDDCCLECIFADADAAANAESFRSRRAAMKIMVENVMAKESVGEEQFYVSKTWLTQWLRKKAVDSPGESDACPTSAITCPHGGLLPEQAAGAKRQKVPEVLWSYFYQIACSVSKQASHAYQPFPVNTDTCRVCEIELNRTVCKQEDLRASKMEQRQKQEALFSGRSIVLSPKTVYYLLPCAWVSQWRAYIGAKKNVLEIEEPVGLEGFVLSLFCRKHGGLLFKPPVLTRNKRGEIVQKSSPDDVYTVISEEDWLFFCQEWDADGSRSIKTYFEVDKSDSNGKDGQTCGEIHELNLPELVTQPEVCRECKDDRENVELMHKLNYANADITVELVQGKEPPPGLLDWSNNNNPDVERRISKRLRRTLTTGSKRVSLTVSGTTSVYQLKMLIWEMLGVVKENQEVHFGKAELSDESVTLADLGIFPGCALWVSDTGVHEHRDIAEELSAAQQGQVEEGFRGTRLLNSCLPSFSDSLTPPIC